MRFKDKYTTNDILTKKASSNIMINPSGISEILVDDEVEKTIISNEAYAIGEMLDTLIEELKFRRGL